VERYGPDPEALNTLCFETRRLTIELPAAGDVDRLYGLVGGDDRHAICSTLAWDGPDDRSEVEWWVEQCRTRPYGEWGFHWVLRDGTGSLTGTAGLAIGTIGTRPSGVPGRGDVGYWLGRRFWRRGLMSEALTGLVELCSSELDYAKLEAEVFAHNEAGRRLAEGVGFELEGVIRRAFRKYGQWVDKAVYGLIV
jgi:RimJ/RimL family protein N-acetyltransferase